MHKNSNLTKCNQETIWTRGTAPQKKFAKTNYVQCFDSLFGPWLLFLLLIAGCTPADGPGASNVETSSPRFTEVTEEADLGAFKHETGGYGQSLMPEIVGGGGGFIDYDGDGWQDILLVSGGTWPHHTDERVQGLHLYRNKGDGTFEEVTSRTGLDGVHVYGFGISAADYDNDGDQDFFLTALHQNKLFRNDTGSGSGRFTEVGWEAGLSDESVWSTSSAFFDADRDGWLDLYVGNYVDWSPEKDLKCMYESEKVFCTPQEYVGRASRFFHNNGDGTFTDTSRESGFWHGVDTTLDKTLGVAVFDFNRDGWPDITTGNDTEKDMLFVNQGDGTFRELGLQSGVAVSQHGKSRAGMGIDTGVVDSTGQVSIFVGNFSDETISVFRYAGNGLFEDRVALSQLAFPSNRTLTFGLVLIDIDLDTDLDLLTANGHVLMHINRISQAVTFRQPPQLFLNRGNGIFDEFEHSDGGFRTPMVARGLAYADYDRDGDIDVLFIENGGPVHLFRNDTAGGSFLRIHLEGATSNRDAIGAHVQAFVDGLTLERWIQTGSSFLSSSEKTATFGLGTHEIVDTLRVFWPGGLVDTFTNVKGNQEIFLKEGSGRYDYINSADQ